MTPVSNFIGLTRWLQAQPRRLLSSAPVVSFPPGESALLGLQCGRFAALRPLLIVTRKSVHRFSPICGARSTALWTAPRSRLGPTTVSDCIPTLYLNAPTTQSAQIRSFSRSGTDRPSRPICSKLPADFQMLRSLPSNLPCDQHTNLPTGCRFETKMSRASLLDARLLAVHPQWLGWLLVFAAIFNLLTPAMRFHLQASSRRTHAYTTSLTGLPQSGCSHRALTTRRSHAQTQATKHWREELLQNNPSGNNI